MRIGFFDQMPVMARFAALLMMLVASSSFAQGNRGAAEEKRVALVIGNSAYNVFYRTDAGGDRVMDRVVGSPTEIGLHLAL